MIHEIRALCFHSHLMMASVFEVPDDAPEETMLAYMAMFRAEVDHMVKEGKIAACCPHCQNDYVDWTFVPSTTSYTSIQEGVKGLAQYHLHEIRTQARKRSARPELNPGVQKHVVN